MTTSRILPIVNVVGCILVTGVIVVQWVKERHLHIELKKFHTEMVASQEKYEVEQKRAAALQNDVNQLKEAVESMAKAKLEFEATLAKDAEEHNARMQAEGTAALDQVKVWEKAISDRDELIAKLNSNLSATRARLDAAVAELKKAGAR